MKINELLKFQEVYPMLAKTKFSIAVAYKISKISKYVEEELIFYQQELQKIIEEYGERNEDGSFKTTDDNTSIKIIPEKLQECIIKMNNLENLEIQESGVKFSLDELSELNLTPDEALGLFPFIE